MAEIDILKNESALGYDLTRITHLFQTHFTHPWACSRKGREAKSPYLLWMTHHGDPGLVTACHHKLAAEATQCEFCPLGKRSPCPSPSQDGQALRQDLTQRLPEKL